MKKTFKTNFNSRKSSEKFKKRENLHRKVMFSDAI